MLGEQFVISIMVKWDKRIVPRPDQRTSSVWEVHKELDHFGIRKIYSMLSSQYWWIGMFNRLLLMSGGVKFVTGSGLALTLCHINCNPYPLWD